jgi:hypothetical protein
MDFSHENGASAVTLAPSSEDNFGTQSIKSHVDLSPESPAPQPFPTGRVPQPLAEALAILPLTWALVPVNDRKAPIGTGWQKHSRSASDFMATFGQNHRLAVEDALPPTVALSSGRIGRECRAYRAPEQYWGSIERVDRKTGVKGPDGKDEALDLRWSRGGEAPAFQSVVVGVHPATGAYQWLPGCAPNEIEVADAPLWMIESMLVDRQTETPNDSVQLSIPPAPTPVPIVKIPGQRPRNPRELTAWDVPVWTDVPFSAALSKRSRAALGGVGSGLRNDEMTPLAYDLHGLDQHFSRIGQTTQGLAFPQFQSACRACTPPLTDAEIDSRWRDAEKRQSKPTLSADAIANCCKKYWRETELASEWAAAKSANKKTPKPVPFEDSDHKSDFHPNLATGLNYTKFTLVGDEIVPEEIHVGDYIELAGHTNTAEGDGAGLYLKFKNQRGQIVTWTMPRRLIGDLNAAVSELAARGYKFVYEQKKLLFKYLAEMGCDVDTAYTIAPRTGWVEVDGVPSFVLHSETIGDDSIRYLDVEPPPNPLLQRVGDLQSWQRTIGAMAIENSRLIAAVGVGVAAPLLKILGIESGGILLYGASSTGKTTALNVTASVTGERSLSTFNATANGTEAAAEAHSDLPLLNDEMGQCDPRGLANTIYMLGNEGGKTRMTKTLAARESKYWRLLFLGTGEIPLIDHLRSAGISTKGGVEARMPSVPADAGRGLGAFDTIHQFATPQQFADELKHQASKNRGCVLVAYLERLVPVANDAEWIERQRKRHLAITTTLIGTTLDPDGTVGRVARRFALIQLALELAQEWRITLFPEGQVEWAVENLFTAWIEARGGAGSIDIRQAMDRIEALFVAQEFGDRIRHVTGDRRDQIVRNLLATKVGPDYLVPPSVFDSEFAQGVDRRLLIAELQKRGWLATGDERHNTKLRRIPGEDGPRRVFVFNRFWTADEAVTPVVTPAVTARNQYAARVLAPEKPVTTTLDCNHLVVTPETYTQQGFQPPCNRVTAVTAGFGVEVKGSEENKTDLQFIELADLTHVDIAPDDFDWSVAGAVA